MVGYMSLEERVDKDFTVARTFTREGVRVFFVGHSREPLEVIAAYYRGGAKAPTAPTR